MRTKEEIFNIIDEEDVEFIRLQFTDIFGNLKNIAITPGQLNKAINNMYSFDGSALFDGLIECPDNLYLHPDLDTFVILPWRPQQGKVAKMFCEVFTEDGCAFELSSRKILQNVINEAKEKGYSFMADPECEFFLFHTDENALPTTITHEKAGYMDVGPVDFGENARRDMVLILEEMGFDIESSHHEHGAAQHEIDFGEQDALQMADSIQTFRFAVRSVAKRFGLYATFMPKPKNNQAGSGMHTSFVMLKDGKNVFRDKDGNISAEAKYFAGGLLKHAKGLCAITNPIVNSYKRLSDGFDAPSRICWSTKGEHAMIKINKAFKDVKIEVRTPDGATNPYLFIAAVIALGIKGIEEKADCGKDSFGEDVTKFELLPGNLKEAVVAFNEDKIFEEIFGKNFINIYTELKNAEWDDYMKSVSEWELDRYLTRM